VIRCRDIEGNEGVTRIHGLKDEDTRIWRVVGVFTPVPFADAQRLHGCEKHTYGAVPEGAVVPAK
jgi:hypothetical protein